MPPEGPWNARRVKVAVSLAAGLSVRAAAAEAAVGERTAHAWLAEADYRSYVTALRDAVLAETIGRLNAAGTAAADALAGLLDSADENVRLRAAVSVLNAMVRVREFGELAARLAALEARLSKSKGASQWG